jgi:hypothetical protein
LESLKIVLLTPAFKNKTDSVCYFVRGYAFDVVMLN